MSKNDNTRLFVGLGILGLFAAMASSKKIRDQIPGAGPVKFILDNWQYAKEAEALTGVPALVTIAQAGIESGWGKSAPGNNFFGIKASSSWKGPVQELKTWECGSSGSPTKDGIKEKVIEIYKPGDPFGNASCNAKGYYSYRVLSKFRSYSTVRDSFIDHGKFLKENKRYAKAFFTSTPEAFITEVHKAGYATDPGYSAKVIGIYSLINKALGSV